MKNLLFVVLMSIAAYNGFAYYKTGSLPLRIWGEQVAHNGLLATLKNFSFSRFFDQTKRSVEEVTGVDVPAPPPEKIQIYKWTDAQGVVHYDNKPVQGAATISINPNKNVLPMEDAPAVEPVDKSPADLNQDIQEARERMRREAEARAGI